MKKSRAGTYIKQSLGYKAYIPQSLLPEPPIKFDDKLWSLLPEAGRALAKLDGITTVLPNPELFVAMYVKKEALLSSQIEGTQATFHCWLQRFDIHIIICIINAGGDMYVKKT